MLLLLAAWIPVTVRAADPELGLADVARQAIESNLDFAAQRRTLAADRENITLARSSLLPQIDIGGQAGVVGDDRSNALFGSTTEWSASVSAGLSQVLYDETSWANYEIQKYVYAAREQQVEAFRLGVVLDAAIAFLELDRAGAISRTQEANRELTRRNLETSRARLAAGWSSERETLRWRSQLAGNERSVVDARTQEIANRFELNRIRNRFAETPVASIPADVATYGFVYARDAIVRAIATPEGDRRLRDALVPVGLARSPVLAAFDDAIAAAERQLTANRRAFWVPSLLLDAGVDHLTHDGSGAPNLEFDDTQWDVGASLTFPLYTGGAKISALRQVREALSSLRIQRRASAQSIDQGIRAAFAQASGGFAAVDFAREQASVAGRNYSLVNDSYVLGVASILALLDAQSQLLGAELAVANALTDFLEALISAEQQMAFYPFLEPEAELTELLDRVERQLVQP